MVVPIFVMIPQLHAEICMNSYISFKQFHCMKFLVFGPVSGDEKP